MNPPGRARVVALLALSGALACASAPPTRPRSTAMATTTTTAMRPPVAATKKGGLSLEVRDAPPGAAPLVLIFPSPATSRAPASARRPGLLGPDDVLPPTALAATAPRVRYQSSPVPPASARGDATESCLTTLDRLGVAYRPGSPRLGIKTPVEILGPIGGVDLAPNGARPPVMDCELARTLAKVAPLFRDLGITGFTSSGAYNYRTRRRSNQLSTHAFGLAIDVHGFETHLGHLEVERDYPRDPARWRALTRRQKPSLACVGAPRTAAARLVRTLACELRHHPSIRLVLSPDDDADHRNHLHIESYPGETSSSSSSIAALSSLSE